MSANQPETLRHTPTPWHVSPHSLTPIYIAAPDRGMTAFVGVVPTPMMTGRGEDVDRANAAFIVEAVNSHERLTARVAELEATIKKCALTGAICCDIHHQPALGSKVQKAIQSLINAALSAADGK